MIGARRAWMIAAGLVAAAILAVAFIGYWAQEPPLAPPAQAVQEVLELRRDRSSDASAYAEYFVSVDLAQMLAADATASAPATGTAGSPIPDWEPPYVSALASDTADVVVRWKPDAAFPSWAPATVFNLELLREAWKIADAQEITGTAPPALSPEDDSEGP